MPRIAVTPHSTQLWLPDGELILLLKLLVIDHDKPAATLMKEVFESKGADVRIIENLGTAVALIEQDKFDGIFLELSLPHGGGVEITKRIRASARNSHTTIMLVGQGASAGAVQHSFAAGATLFLAKPFERNVLAKAISAIRGVMVDERRRHRRITLSNPVRCLIGAREIQECVIRNLCLSGVLLQGDGTIQVHHKVRIAFHLEKGTPLIIARGLVVRVDESGQAGIRVAWDSLEARERIRMRIAKEVDNL